MFENLSSREKKLLIVIGALVPIAIVFLCVYQMTSSFKANNEQLDALKLEILNEEDREIEGMLAARRQTFYSNISLHPSDHIAGHDYQTWLNNAMIDSGLPENTTTPAASSKIRSGNQTIGKRHVFKVKASGTLPQFNDFLCKFYQLDALHRINSMDLLPHYDAKKVRTDEIRITMDVEALSLKSGKEHEGFEKFRTNLVNKEKDYQAILRRNIFGPANKKPILSASNKTCTTGKSFSTSFTAKDANKNDLLTFELIEKSIEEAKIDQISERRVRFEMPDVEPGKYSFKIKISDNGFPSKSSIEEFTVTVKEKRKPTEKVAERKEDPEVDYIRLVKVTGITPDRDGKWRVWVSFGHSGENRRMTVGETFELGKKKYEVVSIDQDRATFAGDKKTFRAQLGWSSQPDVDFRGALIETNL